jgi:hypothetical protein
MVRLYSCGVDSSPAHNATTMHRLSFGCLFMFALFAASEVIGAQPELVPGSSDAALQAALSPAQTTAPPATAGGWRKYEGNPLLGGKYGTCFDVSVLKEVPAYRMWVSWRPKRSVALVESADGIQWSEPPQIVLGPRPETGWENDINRPVVLRRPEGYHMWYTGQARGHSWIGYATSPDGTNWNRRSSKPVLSAEAPWEKVAVMFPYVVFGG